MKLIPSIFKYLCASLLLLPSVQGAVSTTLNYIPKSPGYNLTGNIASGHNLADWVVWTFPDNLHGQDYTSNLATAHPVMAGGTGQISRNFVSNTPNYVISSGSIFGSGQVTWTGGVSPFQNGPVGTAVARARNDGSGNTWSNLISVSNLQPGVDYQLRLLTTAIVSFGGNGNTATLSSGTSSNVRSPDIAGNNWELLWNNYQNASTAMAILTVDFNTNTSGDVLTIRGLPWEGDGAILAAVLTMSGDLPDPVSVTGVSVAPASDTLDAGLTRQLTATVSPQDATNKAVTWSSSNQSVATVSASGLVTALSGGTATITATTVDGGFTATSTITVNAVVPPDPSVVPGATIQLDADGWTVFTLRPGGKIYYVSSSGSDANDGLSEATPFATINWGQTRMSGGDWLLLKRGDVFNQSISGPIKSGPSAEYKTVYGAYGNPADPRPIIDPPGSNSQVMHYHSGHTDGNPIAYLAMVSLHLYQSERDPSSPNYNPSAANGNTAIQLFPNGTELLFEDLRVDFFASTIILQGDVNRSEGGFRGISKVTFRRNVIANSYSKVVGYHSSGIYWEGVTNYLIEENVFDHNGHQPGVTNAEPTIYNHGLYIQGTSTPDNLVRRNIISRNSSHGIQLRPGGRVVENVFIGNGIAGFVADNNITNTVKDAIVMNDNVVLEGATWGLRDGNGNFGSRGWGLALERTDKPIPNTVEMKNNIVANGGSTMLNAYQVTGSLQSAATVSGNITYNWGSASNTPGVFPDPGRTSGSYNASIGGEATMAAFLAAAKNQRKGNWDVRYTWKPIYDYIREGFGIVAGETAVTGVTVLPETASVSVDDSVQLAASVLPIDAAVKEVLWSSSNPSIAAVGAGSGLVTGVSVGTATITATTVDGSFTDTSIITVTPSQLKDISIAYADSPPAIDGNMSEWTDVPGSPIVRLLEGTVDNANDLSGVLKAVWDSDYLYVNIRVLDNIIRIDAGLEPYQRDGIELALNLRNDPNYNLFAGTVVSGAGKFTWVYNDTAQMTRTEPRMLGVSGSQLTEDYQLAFTTITGGYEMEARIPWRNFYSGFVATHGVAFEAELHINDSDDGATREGVISWSGLLGNNTDNAEFGKIRLVGEVSTAEGFWSSIGAEPDGTEADVYHSDWFGYFTELESWDGNWIQHVGFGWAYTGAVVDSANVWLWSPHILGWIYTNPYYFPWVWVFEDAPTLMLYPTGTGWMYFAQTNSAEPGWLYSHALHEWIPVIP